MDEKVKNYLRNNLCVVLKLLERLPSPMMKQQGSAALSAMQLSVSLL
jgi:hypothetical protein